LSEGSIFWMKAVEYFFDKLDVLHDGDTPAAQFPRSGILGLKRHVQACACPEEHGSFVTY
jgi:hypothetical protein